MKQNVVLSGVYSKANGVVFMGIPASIRARIEAFIVFEMADFYSLSNVAHFCTKKFSGNLDE